MKITNINKELAWEAELNSDILIVGEETFNVEKEINEIQEYLTEQWNDIYSFYVPGIELQFSRNNGSALFHKEGKLRFDLVEAFIPLFAKELNADVKHIALYLMLHEIGHKLNPNKDLREYYKTFSSVQELLEVKEAGTDAKLNIEIYEDEVMAWNWADVVVSFKDDIDTETKRELVEEVKPLFLESYNI